MHSAPEPAAAPNKARRWPWILCVLIAVAALSVTLVLVLLGNERAGSAGAAGASKSTASPCRSKDLKPPCQGLNGWIMAR